MSSVRSQEVLVGNTIFVSLSEVWPVSQCPDTRCGPACGAQLSCSLKMIVNQVGCSTVHGAVWYPTIVNVTTLFYSIEYDIRHCQTLTLTFYQ